MNKKLKTDAVDHLFDAILCLENREECYIGGSYNGER